MNYRSFHSITFSLFPFHLLTPSRPLNRITDALHEIVRELRQAPQRARSNTQRLVVKEIDDIDRQMGSLHLSLYTMGRYAPLAVVELLIKKKREATLGVDATPITVR